MLHEPIPFKLFIFFGLKISLLVIMLFIQIFELWYNACVN